VGQAGHEVDHGTLERSRAGPATGSGSTRDRGGITGQLGEDIEQVGEF
jgi:hypothetical protein